MRRKVVLALCAGAIAAPIPVAALAQTGPDVGDVAADAVMHKAELRKEARTAQRAAERRVAEKRQARQAAAAPAVAIPPQLEAIAACESGGDPTAVSADGTYRGLFQFDYGTWASVGGTGDPAAAPASEQIQRAAILYARAGSSPWPICGS
jgi:transglycosylase-like protein